MLNEFAGMRQFAKQISNLSTLNSHVDGVLHAGQVVLGRSADVFVMTEQALYVFGWGDYGQLGIRGKPKTVNKPTILPYEWGAQITDVSCGGSHTAVLCMLMIMFVCNCVKLADD